VSNYSFSQRSRAPASAFVSRWFPFVLNSLEMKDKFRLNNVKGQKKGGFLRWRHGHADSRGDERKTGRFPAAPVAQPQLAVSVGAPAPSRAVPSAGRNGRGYPLPLPSTILWFCGSVPGGCPSRREPKSVSQTNCAERRKQSHYLLMVFY